MVIYYPVTVYAFISFRCYAFSVGQYNRSYAKMSGVTSNTTAISATKSETHRLNLTTSPAAPHGTSPSIPITWTQQGCQNSLLIMEPSWTGVGCDPLPLPHDLLAPRNFGKSRLQILNCPSSMPYQSSPRSFLSPQTNHVVQMLTSARGPELIRYVTRKHVIRKEEKCLHGLSW